MQKEKIDEIIAVVFLTLGIFILLSLVTFNPNDIPLYSSPSNAPVKNFAGFIGAYTGGILLFLMGISAYIFPILFFMWSINRFYGTVRHRLSTRIAGTVILILSVSSLASIIVDGSDVEQFKYGGTFGFFLSNLMIRYCGPMGSYLILTALLILSMILATEFMIFPIFLRLKDWVASRYAKVKSDIKKPPAQFAMRKTPLSIFRRQAREEESIYNLKEKSAGERIDREKTVQKTAPETSQKDGQKEIEVTIHKRDKMKPARPEEKTAEKPVSVKKKEAPEEYKLPSLDLLDSPPPIAERKIREDLKTNSEILESTLADFDIEAKVVRVEQGPVITRYELEPAPGVKVSRITTLSDNIALVMKAQSVRIVAPIPGKGTIGVEIPNSSSSVVYLKEVLDSDEFKRSNSKLSLALGKDIAGKAVIADLVDMPHLLIAGTTGSGKTVCVNCLMTSLLFNMTPDEVKFILIDPKMVELAVFNGLPHLLCPVVTDAKKAAASLKWVVNEMESRYKMLAKVGARNIDLFNQKVEKGSDKWLDDDNSEMGRLPYIVVMIDELADLMIVAKDAIENAITRLAQLSRAVGIHIILATQRPSVDVITGVIKANFPARISFKVASKVDSRTVLDMNGADKLLGRGDMLFIEPGAAKPVRAQGGLVSDSEIERIVNFIKAQREAEYEGDIMSLQEKKAMAKTFEKDELFEEAVRIVFETKQASVSMLQRKLGLGYTRAARLIDAMEDEGIVGPYRGSKPREILVESNEEEETSIEGEGR